MYMRNPCCVYMYFHSDTDGCLGVVVSRSLMRDSELPQMITNFESG